MNILFLCNEYPPVAPGGIGRYTTLMAQWLCGRGHRVVVAGWYKGIATQVHENIDGVEVWRLPMVGGAFGGKIELFATRLNLRIFIERMKKRVGIQLVEGPDYQGSLWLVPGGIPKICRIHSPKILLRRMKGTRLSRSEMIEDWGVQNADYFVAVSEYAKMMAKTYWEPIRSKSVIVIPNPISDCFFYSRKEVDQLSKIKESQTIVFAGSISDHKGVQDLIDAWASVRQKYPHKKLVMYGKEGNSAQHLRDAVRESKGDIAWLGPVGESDLHNAFRSACLGIFPSHLETEGLAAKEAAASGIPIVVSNIPPYRYLFQDTPGVFFFEAENVESLTKAILLALGSISEIETNSLVDRMNAFSLEHVGPMNENFFKKVIEESQAKSW